MVAYSFKKRFAPLIQDGLKCQTIRARRRGRSRHARVGEALQLFTGMRTRHCHKIIPDPICNRVYDIRIRVPQSMEPCQVTLGGETFYVTVDFARADGFESPNDFTQFWFDTHGAGYFEGVLIGWPRPDL